MQEIQITLRKVGIKSAEEQPVDDRFTICPNCGKEFLMWIQGKYAYKCYNNKHRMRYACSYKCLTEIKKCINNPKIK